MQTKTLNEKIMCFVPKKCEIGSEPGHKDIHTDFLHINCGKIKALNAQSIEREKTLKSFS